MNGLILAAFVTGGLGFLGSLVSGFFHLKASRAKKSGNNPHPCRDHADSLKELDNKLDKLGERVSRIEGKLNGMK